MNTVSSQKFKQNTAPINMLSSAESSVDQARSELKNGDTLDPPILQISGESINNITKGTISHTNSASSNKRKQINPTSVNSKKRKLSVIPPPAKKKKKNHKIF